MMAEKTAIRANLWNRIIPYFLTIMSTLVLIAIGMFLLDNIEWYKKSVFSINEASLGAYRIQAYHIHLSIVQRSIGLLSGLAIMFIGLGVSFYSVKESHNINFNTHVLSASLITASPGLIAVLLGGLLIMFTIQSKDEFGEYETTPQNGTYSTTDFSSPNPH